MIMADLTVHTALRKNNVAVLVPSGVDWLQSISSFIDKLFVLFLEGDVSLLNFGNIRKNLLISFWQIFAVHHVLGHRIVLKYTRVIVFMIRELVLDQFFLTSEVPSYSMHTTSERSMLVRFHQSSIQFQLRRLFNKYQHSFMVMFLCDLQILEKILVAQFVELHCYLPEPIYSLSVSSHDQGCIVPGRSLFKYSKTKTIIYQIHYRQNLN